MDKKKIVVLAILLTLVFSPLFAGMLISGINPIAVNQVGIDPVKDFGVAANPSVSTAAICTNPRTTDNLYGGTYETYLFTGNITDSDSAQDVANVSVWFTATAGHLFGMRWINTTNAWTEVAGVEAATTFVGTGANISDANDFNFTLSITFDWTFTDTTDADIVIQAYATDGTEVNNTANVNYDIDTDLVLTTNDFITNAQEEQNSVMEVNTLIYSYEDSSAAVFPLAAQTDFWVTRAASTTPPTYDAQSWQADSYVEASGVATWSTAILAKDTAHTETFSMFAVKQSAGSAGTSVMATDGSDTVTIIEGPPHADNDNGIISDNIMIVIAVMGAGIVGISALYYLYTSKGAVSGSRVGRKNTKRKKSMKKKPRKK